MSPILWGGGGPKLGKNTTLLIMSNMGGERRVVIRPPKNHHVVVVPLSSMKTKKWYRESGKGWWWWRMSFCSRKKTKASEGRWGLCGGKRRKREPPQALRRHPVWGEKRPLPLWHKGKEVLSSETHPLFPVPENLMAGHPCPFHTGGHWGKASSLHSSPCGIGKIEPFKPLKKKVNWVCMGGDHRRGKV